MNEDVAIFMSSLRGGGAERAMVKLLSGLDQRGVNIDLLLVRAEGTFLSDVPPSVNIVELKASRIVTALPTLIRYLRSVQPDALLSVLEGPNIVSLWAHALANADSRLVVVSQNNLPAIARNWKKVKEIVLPYLVSIFYPWADSVVTVSEGVAKDLCKELNIQRQHVEVVYNPVVDQSLSERARETANHPWLHSKGMPVILGIGRLQRQKNFPLLLRSFAKLRRKRTAKLIILGEGEDRHKLEALSRDLGVSDDVDLPGFVENPLAYLSSSSVFALSSDWEGLPTVLIEALACGCPIVSTNCPSGPQEILEDGRWGNLVPPGDEEALASSILDTLDSTQRPDSLRERAQDFSKSKAVDRYIEILLG